MVVRPRWRKVLADLWSNHARSLLVVLSIAVGLFAVGVIGILHQVVPEDLRNGYQSTNPANIQVFTSDFDQDLVDQIGRMPGVKDVLGVRSFDLRVTDRDGNTKTIQIKAIPDPQSMNIDVPRLVKGTWPPQKDQIVIDRYKFDQLGIQLGDTIQVELPSGDTRDIPVVGEIQDQTIGVSGLGGGFFLAPIQGYVDRDTLDWLEEPNAFNLLYVNIDDGGTNLDTIQALSQRVKNEVEDGGYVVYAAVLNQSTDHPNSTYVDAITGILLVLGVLVLFLSGSLISNTLTALLNQQIQQIGMMKTLGARRSQIIVLYMVLIVCFSLLALVIAVPLSRVAAFALLNFLSGKINFVPSHSRYVPGTLLLQVVLALIVPQIAGILPILKGSRISVQESLSGVPGGGSHPQHSARLARGTRILPRPLLLSLRNTFRQRTRLALTLLTLALGGAIFTATFNVNASISNHIERLGNYFMADVNLTFDQDYRIDEVANQLANIPGVKSVEGWGSATCEIVYPDGTTHQSVHLLAPPSDSKLVKPVLTEGRWIQPGDGDVVTLNENFRDGFPDLKVGQSIRFKINGEESDWTVIGFFQMAGKSGGFLAYVPYESFARVTHDLNQTDTYRFVANASGLTLQQQKQLAQVIEKDYTDAGYQVLDSSAGKALLENSADGLNTLSTFLLIMAVLTALVGSIGLAGTLSLNVMERTREIGVLRAIGASNRSVMQMVLVEGGLIGLISWLLGSLLAFPISNLLANTVSLAIFNSPLQVVYTPAGFLIWLGVALVFAIAASFFPARNAVRLTIREVLSYE